MPDGYGARPAQGMGKGDGRGEQPDSVGGEVDVPEGGGGEQEGVHRRADVVVEPRQCEVRRAAAAARLVGRLVHVDGQAGAGQEKRGDQPVRAGAHHDGVW